MNPADFQARLSHAYSSMESEYSAFFCNEIEEGKGPYDYQIKVALSLFDGKNVVLRAPTGAGKTKAVLAPYLFPEWTGRPARLIYALPLRTLAQGIYAEAQELARRLGYPLEAQTDGKGREVVTPFVTIQTGEQPDDPFFDRGRIIVTTYDQVLSGLLDGPYGLSSRLHNVNAASIAGALVVFDEFHLMQTERAFLTAAAFLNLFRDLCQSVWMTATATQPLEKILRDALGAVPIPATEEELDNLLESLPSVSRVTRHMVMEDGPLSAEAILQYHQGRSLVLLNTVGRAQAMYEELRERLTAQYPKVPLMLLHSRFFKENRRAKEEKLRSLFGKESKGRAILVATQVVEAGLDISCDHLHTELCPMNSLVQRAGRCARFAGETGTVHVYPLPPVDRAWLPYGSQSGEDVTLTKSRELLTNIAPGGLDPKRATEWVREVHAAQDERALSEGWRSRLSTCMGRIQQNAILRDPKRVADLIRGDDTDSVRVVIEDATHLEAPGQREALSLSRGLLRRFLQTSAQETGWFWDASGDDPWKPLRTQEDLNRAYVVCLPPTVAAYDSEVGLRLGVCGDQRSPSRIEPKRPGYSPLRAESWTDHALNVANEAMQRLQRERWDSVLVGVGFGKRYGITAQALMEAVRACALLHDMGKLQDGWQRWAKASQEARDPSYQHTTPLAHTDFDSENPADRKRERGLGIKRPSHAPASAYYGGAMLARLLPSVPEARRKWIASACAAAILAHHGSWLPKNLDLGVSGLYPNWKACVTQALGWGPDAAVLQRLQNYTDKRGRAQELLAVATGPDTLIDWWPLVAYLTRTLRLSDQHATAEGASTE